MKLNLEKNFKSLFKTKVSFTMAALTIFAITGGVSFADDVPPLKEDLDPMNTTIKPIEEINKTNKQVNQNWAGINGNRGAIANVGGAINDEITRSTGKDTEHDTKIAANKKAIDDEVTRSTGKDTEHDTKIAANKKAIEANKDAVQSEIVDRTKADLAEENARKAADKKHDAAIAANKAGIEANASAIKHLDSKLNKTTAMMTAMNNVDFQDVNVGEVAIGAGVGHFVGDQAVAVGVAGDPHYNAIGGGVTYKFRTR